MYDIYSIMDWILINLANGDRMSCKKQIFCNATTLLFPLYFPVYLGLRVRLHLGATTISKVFKTCENILSSTGCDETQEKSIDGEYVIVEVWLFLTQWELF